MRIKIYTDTETPAVSIAVLDDPKAVASVTHVHRTGSGRLEAVIEIHEPDQDG